MGAAIEVFEGAQAIAVDRTRFLPVKTTDDLLVLGSDAYDVGPDGVPRLLAARAPLVDLDPRYRAVAQLAARFPHGAPSLRGARSLTVRGDWTFGAGVRVEGDASLADTGRPERIADGWIVDAAGAHPPGDRASPPVATATRGDVVALDLASGATPGHVLEYPDR